MAKFTGTNGPDILPNLLFGLLQAGGNDDIQGYGGNDLLVGFAGNDTLEGGTGGDVLIGGTLNVLLNVGAVSLSGNDTASYASSVGGVSVNLSDVSLINLDFAGIQLALTGASQGHGGDAEGDVLVGITNVIGSNANDVLIGNASSNRLEGLGGADYLDGGRGVDTMIGGTGSDTYIVDNSQDVVVELASQGFTDAIITNVSYVLAAGSEIEILRASDIAGTAAINLIGNKFDQALSGNAGHNVLNGMGGVDTMTGGLGNDTYVVDNAGDEIRESAGEGYDRLAASADYVLARGVSIESLSTTLRTGTAAIDLTGNELSQVMTGNAGANILNGRDGRDALTGLGGDDVFVFDRPLSFNNVDRVLDFGDGDDQFWLSSEVFSRLGEGNLAASAFHEGFRAADASDRIIYDHTTGALFYDSDGTGAAQAVRFATLSTDLTLTNSDFFII